MVEADRDRVREFLKWADALIRAMDAAVRVDDPHGLWKHAGYRLFARKYNDLTTLIAGELPLPPILDAYKLDAIPGNGDTLPDQRKEIFDSVYMNLSLLKGILESRLGVAENETEALRDFLQARLRSGVLHMPDKELDIQDAVETLFIGRGLQKGVDYDREVGRVKVSAKEVLPDFVLPRWSLAVEVKLVRTSTRLREIIDEINADIQAYSKRYRALLVIVYDLGQIRDEIEFKRDLEDPGHVSVVVVKQ